MTGNTPGSQQGGQNRSQTGNQTSSQPGGQQYSGQDVGPVEFQSSQQFIQCLSGLKYPASQQQVVQWAQQHNATPELIQMFQRLPEAQYTNQDDILANINTKNLQLA